MTTLSKNEVLLEGTAQETPRLSHENHGAAFYRFMLEVPRLSGQTDCLPVLLPEELAPGVCRGRPVRVRGQMRSFNNRSGVGNRLVLSVYAQELPPVTGTACNQILLSGALCKPPIFRRTPLGRSICDLMLAVGRRYSRADYLPVIAWGQTAVKASHLSVGDAVSLKGRVQSRVYHKLTEAGAEDRTAYEVSAMHLLDPGEAL